MKLDKELKIARKLAVKAGIKIMGVYDSEFNVLKKEDNSPLTKADLIANETIVTQLRRKFPDYSILTEEEVDNKDRLKSDFVWVIDPLDGTKEFISRNGEFSVNIALTYKGKPILGVIYVPVKKDLYYASEGNGAFYENNESIRKIKVSDRKNINEMILVKSRSHASNKLIKLINKLKFADVKTMGSSLKGCLIAIGEADVYFRFGPTNEWDICAMNAIVNEAGGIMTDLNGNFIKYNRKNIKNNGFIVSNNKMHKKLIEISKRK